MICFTGINGKKQFTNTTRNGRVKESKKNIHQNRISEGGTILLFIFLWTGGLRFHRLFNSWRGHQPSGKTMSSLFFMVDEDINLPEKRCPRRLLWLTGTSTFREKRCFRCLLWLTGTSTFRRNDVLRLHLSRKDCLRNTDSLLIPSIMGRQWVGNAIKEGMKKKDNSL
mgnify:CR=1 FL=1